MAVTHELNTRRAFLTTLGTSLATLSLPLRETHGAESMRDTPYELRDIKEVYALWSSNNHANYLPSFEVFERSVQVARQAACSIFLMKGSELAAMHSAFVVSVPEEHQTEKSRGRAYVVTCDHARLQFAGTKPIVQLANGQNLTPRAELVTKQGAKGLPSKDLRVYEVDAKAVTGIEPFALRGIDSRPPQQAPVMTYEPLNLRAPQIVDDGRPVLEPSRGKRTLEKFVLTHITDPVGFPYDASYPQSSGFATAGQLRVGGSGSPVILFTETDFYVAGHQVSYGIKDDPDRALWFDGEINQDGHVVHINNAIKLLRDEGRWR